MTGYTITSTPSHNDADRPVTYDELLIIPVMVVISSISRCEFHHLLISPSWEMGMLSEGMVAF